MGYGIPKIREYLRHRGKRKASPIQIAFVILVSDEIHNFMRGLEVELFHKYGVDRTLRDNPHISLKQGFEVDALEPFEAYFDKLAKEIRPFEIVIDGIGFFDQGIIYLDVKKDPRLETLRRRILRDLAGQFGVRPNPLEDERYHFHATLASGFPTKDFPKARQACETIRAEYRFVFDTLGLLYHIGGQWIIYKRSNVNRAEKADGGTAGA
jgi:2'-5' RNA ligase